MPMECTGEVLGGSSVLPFAHLALQSTPLPAKMAPGMRIFPKKPCVRVLVKQELLKLLEAKRLRLPVALLS